MDCSAGAEGPAILQLHKWGPLELPHNLSEYREAFISPTRELLLLLSYQCQALLLPLTKGGSVDADVSENCYDESPQNLDLLACRSNLKDDIPCTSGSATGSDNGMSLEHGFSSSNGYPFLFDVNSLAWGVCEDTYNQHKDGSFRELLFVSGKQGVMVHAFTQLDKSSAPGGMLEGEYREGTWVEWGPSSSSFQHITEEKPIDFSFEVSQNTINKSIANENLGVPEKISKKVGDDVLSGTGTSKRWLRSFFTKAETVEYEGSISTRFPQKSSFPCSAKVVSFGIFTSNFPVLRFLCKEKPSSSEESCRETIRNVENGSRENIELNASDVRSNTPYKCTRVFSSNSHQLVGFFLTLMNSASANASDGSEKMTKNIIVIARLDIWGIQWVSLVKLQQNVNTCPMEEWKDFHFSDVFLICLNASGLVFFYDAVSGEHFSQLDILQTCGLNCFANLPEPERSTLDDDRQSKTNYQHGDLFGRRTFKRLLVISYTSLLAVVDDYDIVYVIHAGDCLPDKYYADEKLLPHYQHLGLAMFVGWDVGSSDVSHQRIYIGSPISCSLNSSSKTNEIVSFCDNTGNNILQKVHGWNHYGNGFLSDSVLNGFSASSKVINEKVHNSQIQFHLMRKVFLPTDRYGDDDCICFSPFGITRLIRRHNFKDCKSSQIVHFDLHTDSVVQDDRFLNLGSKNFSLQGREEVSIGEAVGCTFQGCFYLVTDGGLSVVLPSVSVSSNLLPIESIGYQQPSISTAVECQAKNILGLEEPKMFWSPWKVEILDRVLLYEGPEEADRVCLENGWDLKFSRIRRLQVALDYLKFDEVKQSLEMLGGVKLAEEGVLRILFAAVYLMFGKSGNGNEAESMVVEWKEFLGDVPEERVALWSHCQTLFIRYSYPALQAGLFFLKHAEAVEKDLPARELYEMLLLSLQWLSGMITQSIPVYQLHLLREIETRVWLLAVESEAQVKSEGEICLTGSSQNPLTGNISNIIDRTASIITKMDNHINSMKNRTAEKYDAREPFHRNQALDSSSSTVTTVGSSKTKRRAKGYVPSRRPLVDPVDKGPEPEDSPIPPNLRNDVQLQDESSKIEISLSKWEERIEPEELERAVLSLLEFGQISAAKQLQQKLSPGQMPSEFILIDTALKLAALSTPTGEIPIAMLDEELFSVIQSYTSTDEHLIYPLQVLETLAAAFTEGSGHGLCKRIIAVVKAANVLGLSFSEAFGKQPIELLQLLSLKAQESFEEANLLVQTYVMPAASIAQILAESFLKGLLAAHRGGYMDSQKEEGPAPLLWRFSDFLKWAELCPSEPEIGHALMRLVITGQEIPLACEVELLILSHHFYKSSACHDGVDVLVALAATRVEAYVSEGDFACLARLITGVGNFHALNFILGILIENGQLDLLIQKYSTAADTNTGTAEAVRAFRMAVLTSLKHFNPYDLDAFAMVYNHFDMKHETASLLESRAEQASLQWFECYDRDQNEDLLEAMRYFVEAAEVLSSIDAGNKTRRACAQASLVSLQIRIPDSKWLNLSETNARRALVEQSRFLEALIVAEAYGLNQPTEWALVLWNQMLNPELTEEFVAVLPFQPSMLIELARFYRAEVAARGDQSQFSVWLTGGGLPAEWAKYLGRSFRCLLQKTRDLRLRLQLATSATGFADVVDACMKPLDRVPDTAGPLVLRKGHGGAYLPLM